MGCFGKKEPKGGREGDFDWEDFENPVADGADSPPVGRVRSMKGAGRQSTLSGSVGTSREMMRGGGSVDSFDKEDSGDRGKSTKPKRGRRGSGGKSPKNGTVGSNDSNGLEVEDGRRNSPGTRNIKLEPNHAGRLAAQLAYTTSTVAEGITQGIHDTYGEGDKDGNEYLEIIDWTSVHDMYKLKQECEARGLATHGRALSFSKIALQNSLNKFDRKERNVDHKASHIDHMTFDRERNWREAKVTDKNQLNMMDSLKNKTTGAH